MTASPRDLFAKQGRSTVGRAQPLRVRIPEPLLERLATYGNSKGLTLAETVRSVLELGGEGADAAPLASHADWTHPLYETWISMGLDDLEKLHTAWFEVTHNVCPQCTGDLERGPYEPLQTCGACQLCFITSKGYFAIDTLERAQERGPDA